LSDVFTTKKKYVAKDKGIDYLEQKNFETSANVSEIKAMDFNKDKVYENNWQLIRLN
jgi:hypothetical protein